MADVVDRDLGWGRFMAGVEELEQGVTLEAGIFVDEVAEYMAHHEFGTRNHSETAWFRSAMDANRERYLKMETEAIAAILFDGVDPERALEPLAKVVKRDLQRSIQRHGLVDTGRALRSVETRARRGGGSS